MASDGHNRKEASPCTGIFEKSQALSAGQERPLEKRQDPAKSEEEHLEGHASACQ